MQKQFLYLCMCALFVSSCSDDYTTNTVDTLENIPDVQVVNLKDYISSSDPRLRTSSGMEDSIVLKFKDENAFIKEMQKMEGLSDEERSKYMSRYQGFISIDSIYNQAMREADSLEFETPEEYFSYKAKYEKYLYFPEYGEDFGAYLPYKEKEIASVSNKDGIFLVGNTLYQEDRISTYQELQETGGAYYEDSLKINTQDQESIINNLRSSDDFKYYNGRDKKIDNLGGRDNTLTNGFDSKWLIGGKGNKRKMKLKVNFIYTNPSNKIALQWHTEVSFRKKTIFGWANYSSETRLKGNIYTIDDNKKIVDRYILEHNSGHASSHDGRGAPVRCILIASGKIIVDDKPKISNGGAGNVSGRDLFHLPTVQGRIEVYYQGFGTTTVFQPYCPAVTFATPINWNNETNYNGVIKLNGYQNNGYTFSWSKYFK